MKRVLVLLAVSVACLAVAGPAAATDSQATIRLSWDGCDPQVVDKVFTTATIYKLILSGDNFTPGATDDNNVGSDFSIDFRPVVLGPLADAWRFDDAGCQTGSQLSLSASGVSKTCLTMQGGAPLPITSYSVDVGTPNYASMRLANTYNEVSPLAGTRYTFWQVSFDHLYSVAGATTPGVDCGNAAAQMCIGWTSAILATVRGDAAKLQNKIGDVKYVTWNTPGTCDGVPTVPATWGKVKSLYR
jgi:hypothetical protein